MSLLSAMSYVPASFRSTVRKMPSVSTHFLSPHVDLALLAVLPRLARGRSEKLVMIRTASGTANIDRLVLRLWRSDGLIPMPDGAMARLWIGTIVAERVQTPFSTLNITEDARNLNTPLRQLVAALPDGRIVGAHARRPRRFGTEIFC
ncbi:LssY C-terminal domain-containing protein [Acidiphilium sp. PA]|uniref:hypothetical protein n=1 Tax=Acidiphilium sp. PA TaxID=2871705 RepID=UPI002243CDE7|nr:hypothetical protein [Acidiphilium sp. PA]MCW8309299.1 LssY C-terminal domain-containing protein [Acidiphilium sp. PA]